MIHALACISAAVGCLAGLLVAAVLLRLLAAALGDAAEHLRRPGSTRADARRAERELAAEVAAGIRALEQHLAEQAR